MKSLLCSALLLAASPAFAQSKIGDAPAVVPFESFVERFLSGRGLTGRDRSEISFEEVLRKEYVRFDLGLYDLRFPREECADEEMAEDFRDLVEALLRSQELFLAWVEPKRGRNRTVEEDLKRIRRWVGKWRPSRMDDAREADLLRDGLDADEDDRKALDRFAAFMRGGSPVGLEREEPRASRMILAPTRPRFLELACFAGWYYPHLQQKFWDEGLGTWLGCRIQESQVLSFMFASPDISKGDFELGLTLDYKSDTVLQQHAVHFATQALFDNYYGDTIPPFLSTGLALNMVLEQFGEVDTRIEGDLRARFTEAQSVFVPGGASGGGTLPPMNPDGRWRQTKGRGHFLELLRTSQEEGADMIRRASEKYLHFEIEHDDQNAMTTVAAPFLGSPSDGKELPPEDYLGDYQEFFRAYKSAFAHWLRTEAAGGKSKCEATFASFLTGLAEDGTAESLMRELYGDPLSSEVPDRDTLEGNFLYWISRQ